MEYPEAVKKVQARKPKEPFMVITFERNSKIILPYKDGLAIMAALSNAEVLEENWGKPNRIKECDKDTYQSHSMTYAEYECHKIALLLDISIDEVKEMYETK